jgi:hypothetical protein
MFPRTAQQLVRRAMLLLLAAALFAPAATAGRYGPGSSSPPASMRASTPPQTTCHQYCGSAAGRQVARKTTPVIVRTELVSANDRGFDWLAAAIGFGAAWGAILLGGAALFARHRVQLAHAEPVS